MTRQSRLVVAGLSLLAPSVQDALAQSQPPLVCASVGNAGGTWLPSSSTLGTYTITQQTNSVLNGSFVPPLVGNCAAGTPFSISGNMNTANGGFSISGSPDHPVSGCLSFVTTGTVSEPYCDIATVNWTNSDGTTGEGVMSHQCYYPSGESAPQFSGWDGSYGMWQMTVTPPTSIQTYNFGGRTVTESNTSGMQASDTCWQTGDPSGYEITGITSGDWVINSGTNTYGVDYVGYGAAEVLYYRAHRRTPCSANVYQTMSMTCNSGPVAYQNYVLSATIGRTTVGSAKGGISEIETYGPAQGEIINIINSILLLQQSN